MIIDQGELFRIPNPCIGVCENNNRGYCKGCLRSRQERFGWNDFSEYQRHLVVQVCQQRRKRILAAQAAREAELNKVTLTREQFDLFGEPLVFEESIDPPESPSPQIDLFD